MIYSRRLTTIKFRDHRGEVIADGDVLVGVKEGALHVRFSQAQSPEVYTTIMDMGTGPGIVFSIKPDAFGVVLKRPPKVAAGEKPKKPRRGSVQVPRDAAVVFEFRPEIPLRLARRRAR